MEEKEEEENFPGAARALLACTIIRAIAYYN
jgi:hypothetical protein